MRVEPGLPPPGLDRRNPDIRPHSFDKKEGLDRSSGPAVERLAVLHDRLFARGHARRRARPPGPRRVRQGRDDPERATGVNPQGAGRRRSRCRPRPSSPTTTSGGCTRVPAARRDRDLQPLALRGRGRRPASGSSRRETSGAGATRTSAASSACSSTRARRSSRSSCTSRGRSSASGSRRGIDDPEKRWKFRLATSTTAQRWDEFTDAYEDADARDDHRRAPWYVVPADHNWVAEPRCRGILVETLERLDPQLRPAVPRSTVSRSSSSVRRG